MLKMKPIPYVGESISQVLITPFDAKQLALKRMTFMNEKKNTTYTRKKYEEKLAFSKHHFFT